MVLACDVDAVANALGVRDGDRVTDVEAQICGRDEAGHQLAGVQGDVHAGIQPVQVADHLHVHVVIAQRHRVILGRDDVDADVAGIVCSQLHVQQQLGEHGLRGLGADDLGDEPDRQGASGVGLRRVAVQHRAELRKVGISLRAGGRDDLVHRAALEQPRAHSAQVRVEADLSGRRRNGAGLSADHRLQIELVLSCRTLGVLGIAASSRPPTHPATTWEGWRSITGR